MNTRKLLLPLFVGLSWMLPLTSAQETTTYREQAFSIIGRQGVLQPTDINRIGTLLLQVKTAGGKAEAPLRKLFEKLFEQELTQQQIVAARDVLASLRSFMPTVTAELDNVLPETESIAQPYMPAAAAATAIAQKEAKNTAKKPASAQDQATAAAAAACPPAEKTIHKKVAAPKKLTPAQSKIEQLEKQTAQQQKEIQELQESLKIQHQIDENQKQEALQKLHDAFNDRLQLAEKEAINAIQSEKSSTLALAKDIAIVMALHASPLKFGWQAVCRAGIGVVAVPAEFVDARNQQSKKINEQDIISEMILNDHQHTLRMLEEEQYEEFRNQYRQLTRPTLWEQLYASSPDNIQIICSPLLTYQNLRAGKFQANALPQALIAGYDEELQQAMAAIDYCYKTITFTNAHKAQLSSLYQLFREQRLFLQALANGRYNELLNYSATLSERNINELHALDTKTQKEIVNQTKNFDQYRKQVEKAEKDLMVCRSKIEAYNKSLRLVNLAWDMVAGETEQDCRREYTNAYNHLTVITKKGFEHQTELEHLKAQHDLIQKTLVVKMPTLRPILEQSSAPCKQGLLAALDQTIGEKGIKHALSLNADPAVVNYLQRLGCNTQDFGTYNVNAFQARLIEEGAAIITYGAQHQDENPTIISYLDLSTTTAKLCIDQVEAGNIYESIDLVMWSNYLKECCDAFKQCAGKAFKEGFYFREIAKGWLQFLNSLAKFDDFGTLQDINLFTAKYCPLTPAQQLSMALMLLENQQYIRFMGDAYAKMWRDNFKDGKLKGIARILGNISGNLGSGYVIGELAGCATLGRLPFAPVLNAMNRGLMLEGKSLNLSACLEEFIDSPEFIKEMEQLEKLVEAVHSELPAATEQQLREAIAPLHEALGQAVEQLAEKVKLKAAEKLYSNEITDNLIDDLYCKNSELSKYIDPVKIKGDVNMLAAKQMHITHLKRNFHIDGKVLQMKSGHSYYRTHLGGGDLRGICSINEIEETIIKDFIARGASKVFVNADKAVKITINFKGIKIQYEPFDTGRLFSFDYYPLK